MTFYRNILALPVLFLLVIMAGCATTNPMALTTETKAIDLSKGSIALFSLKTTNKYKAIYQPNASALIVQPPNKSGKTQPPLSFKLETPAQSVEQKFNKYLVSVTLEPGKYLVKNIIGQSTGNQIKGSFSIPLFQELEIPDSKIIYLGSIDATNREKKEGELAAGSIIPLRDQTATGYGYGTFDVAVSDKFDNDIEQFVNRYPVLAGQSIEKQLLPSIIKVTNPEVEKFETY